MKKNKSIKLEEINAALKEINAALKVLLRNQENDKNEMEEKIVRNVRELVLPYLEKLKATKLSSTQADLVDIAEDHIREIVSSFLLKMESSHPDLTPRELQVVSLIKDGHTTKEISGVLHLEITTINNHRQRIRKKITLSGRKKSLRSYLLSFPKFDE